MHQPQEITRSEWEEILKTRAVQDALQLAPNEPAEQIISTCYGVKFAFIGNDSAACNLYIIQGHSLSMPPVVLVKYGGLLQVEH